MGSDADDRGAAAAREETAPPADLEGEAPLAMTWTTGRVAAVVAILAIALFWAWVFSGAPAKQNPDYLDDRTYAAALEARCTELRTDIGELPRASETPERLDRAEVIDQANAMIGEFIDDVSAAAPTTGEAGTAMEGWLADWRTYLADREDYVDRLRNDEGDRFYVDESPLGDTVDRTIEVFADINRIPDCATPGDVG